MCWIHWIFKLIIIWEGFYSFSICNTIILSGGQCRVKICQDHENWKNSRENTEVLTGKATREYQSKVLEYKKVESFLYFNIKQNMQKYHDFHYEKDAKKTRCSLQFNNGMAEAQAHPRFSSGLEVKWVWQTQ